MKHKKFVIGNAIGIAVSAAVLIALNVVALGTNVRQLITTYLGGSGLPANDEVSDAYGHAGQVVDQIMDEGMVLLKNENNALPLAPDTPNQDVNVNVFGINTINMYYGGSGSGASSTADAETYLSSYKDAHINYNQDIIDLMKDHLDEADTNVGNPLGNTFYPARPTIDLSLYQANLASYKDFSDKIGRSLSSTSVEPVVKVWTSQLVKKAIKKITVEEEIPLTTWSSLKKRRL